MSVKRLTTLAVFACLSLAIYAVESMLPPLFPYPGMKLGLANIITLFLLKEGSLRDASLVLAVRILLSALLFGNLMSLSYSAAGGLLSLLAMAGACHLCDKKYLFLAGALGGLSHNLGQLLIAYVLTGSVAVFVSYLPLLALCGILTGIFTGASAGYVAAIMPKGIAKLLKD